MAPSSQASFVEENQPGALVSMVWHALHAKDTLRAPTWQLLHTRRSARLVAFSFALLLIMTPSAVAIENTRSQGKFARRHCARAATAL
jgi:hypothetical protein